MITTRLEKIEQLLTDDCRKALAEIDAVICEITLDEFNFDQDDLFIVNMETQLDEKEAYLVTELLKLAGWKSITIDDDQVRFYF